MEVDFDSQVCANFLKNTKRGYPACISKMSRYSTHFFKLSLISLNNTISSGVGGAGLGSSSLILLMILTIWKMTKASKIKLMEIVMKLPYAKIGIPAFLRASKVRGTFSGTVPSTINRLVKSILPPRRVEMRGMTMSLTRESTIFPKAPPIMTPTARSTTLPRTAKARNSFIILDATVFSWYFGGLGHF